MEKKRHRGQNFTTNETIIFLNIVEKFKKIIENKLTTGVVIQQKNEAWDKIAQELNTMSTTIRTTSQLKTKYDNLKMATRRYIAKSKNQLPIPEMTPYERREHYLVIHKMLQIINIKDINGDTNEVLDENTYQSFESSISPTESKVLDLPSTSGTQLTATSDQTLEDGLNQINYPLTSTRISPTYEIGEPSNSNHKRKRKRKVSRKFCNRTWSLTEAKIEYYKTKTKLMKVQMKELEAEIRFKTEFIKYLDMHSVSNDSNSSSSSSSL